MMLNREVLTEASFVFSHHQCELFFSMTFVCVLIFHEISLISNYFNKFLEKIKLTCFLFQSFLKQWTMFTL